MPGEDQPGEVQRRVVAAAACMVSSLVSPVSRAAATASEPSTATSVSPNSVPIRAVVVRAEKPCAR